MSVEKIYGVWNETHKCLMSFKTTTSNGDDFSGSTRTELIPSKSSPWFVETKEEARKAADTNNLSYAATYRSPANEYISDGLTAVEITMALRNA